MPGFQQLIEQGADVEGIARRFGLTVRFVEGRLRLASLAPVVFDALGAGEITLDVAKAYAATPDQERQAFVFEQVGRSYMAQHPDSIRRMMTQATVSVSDRRARFVGEEAYAAAGGRIERDLFSDEDGARWLDIALLERLATEKLEAFAAQAAASSGLAFVRPTLESWAGYEVTRGLQRVPLDTPPLSDEESAEVDALEAEAEELIGQLEDEQTDRGESRARGKLERKIAQATRQINRLVDAIGSGASTFEEVRLSLTDARDQREAWKEELAAIDGERVIALHPAVAEDYRRAVGTLNVALADSNSPEAREQAIPRIRALIDTITLTPAARGRGVDIEMTGRLATMIELATGRSLGEGGRLTMERVKGIEPSS